MTTTSPIAPSSSKARFAGSSRTRSPTSCRTWRHCCHCRSRTTSNIGSSPSTATRWGARSSAASACWSSGWRANGRWCWCSRTSIGQTSRRWICSSTSCRWRRPCRCCSCWSPGLNATATPSRSSRSPARSATRAIRRSCSLSFPNRRPRRFSTVWSPATTGRRVSSTLSSSEPREIRSSSRRSFAR